METKEYEEINAYPSVSMISDIEINDKDTSIRIGGWSVGGFYLEEPYMLKEEKNKSFSGKNLTYYSIIKDKKLQSKREKEVREMGEKRRKEDVKYYKESIKNSKELIDNYTKKLKELEGSSSKKSNIEVKK